MATRTRYLQAAVGSLEDRLATWETKFLPAIFEQMAETQPLDRRGDLLSHHLRQQA